MRSIEYKPQTSAWLAEFVHALKSSLWTKLKKGVDNDIRLNSTKRNYRRSGLPLLNQWLDKLYYKPNINYYYSRVADPGCLSRIRIFSIPDPGSISKNLSILTKKNVFYTLGNMIRVVHPGSGS
jgi:hypothetical protein